MSRKIVEKMKYLIVILLINSVFAIFPLIDHQPVIPECQHHTGASVLAIISLTRLKPETRHENKCFRYCLAKKYHILDEHDQPNFNNLRSLAYLYLGNQTNKGIDEFAKQCTNIDLSSDK